MEVGTMDAKINLFDIIAMGENTASTTAAAESFREQSWRSVRLSATRRIRVLDGASLPPRASLGLDNTLVYRSAGLNMLATQTNDDMKVSYD